jgi:hypothetical protein
MNFQKVFLLINCGCNSRSLPSSRPLNSNTHGISPDRCDALSYIHVMPLIIYSNSQGYIQQRGGCIQEAQGGEEEDGGRVCEPGGTAKGHGEDDKGASGGQQCTEGDAGHIEAQRGEAEVHSIII